MFVRLLSSRDVKADLSAPFAGDGSQSFLSWRLLSKQQWKEAMTTVVRWWGFYLLAWASWLFCYGTTFLIQSDRIILLLKRNWSGVWTEIGYGPFQGQPFLSWAFTWLELVVDVSRLIVEVSVVSYRELLTSSPANPQPAHGTHLCLSVPSSPV